MHKTFTFGADYLIHADTVVLRNSVPLRALLSWPAGLGDMETAAGYAYEQVDTGANGSDDHTAPKKISGGATLNGPFDFAGFSDQYFGAIFLPDSPQDATMVTFNNLIDAKDIPPAPAASIPSPAPRPNSLCSAPPSARSPATTRSRSSSAPRPSACSRASAPRTAPRSSRC